MNSCAQVVHAGDGTADERTTWQRFCVLIVHFRAGSSIKEKKVQA